MKCAKKDCCWGNLVETSPCSVCSQPVHHLCSNELCTNAELSKRFCSRQCVKTLFTADGDAGEFTPSSISGISVSSEATVVDLRRDEQEVVTATTNSIPDEIHKLEKPKSHKSKKYTHICLECLKEHHWKDSLCNATHTSNAKTHLLLGHKDHPEAVKEKDRRLQRASRFTEVKPNKKEQKQPHHIEEQARDAKRLKTLWPASQDQISGFIARLLIQDGLPYNTVTTPAFRELIIGITGNSNVKIPSSKTFNDILDETYDNFEKDTKAMLSKEFMELHETPFLTLEHDLCTNKSKNTIVGASCGFIDQQWKPRKLALLAQVKNDGHCSEEVATMINDELKQRYGLDADKMARFIISDTAAAARKVSKQFDNTLQTDCVMHSLNLCIGYGIGLKENTKTSIVHDPKTKTFVRKKIVITKGGAFPEGGRLIQKLRSLNNYFASSRSPERIEKLKDVQGFYKLPQLSALVDIDVRVASTIKLFRRSIINYSAFNAFFQRADLPDTEKKVFTCISEGEWELVVQMEAVMQRIADLALVESQSATMISSTMYVLLRVASARMNSCKFSAYSLKGIRTADTNEKNFPRYPLTLPDLCDLTQRCIMRTLHQIASRLPEPSVAMGMALLLDPRTKRAATNYLWIPDTSEAATDKILTKAKEGLRTEHRVIYKALFAIDSCEEETLASTSRSPSGDCNSSSDTELDLICGEEVMQSTEESVADADAALNAKADELLEQWLNHRIEWDQVAKHQYSDKKECEMVISHLTICNRRHRNVRVWNVEQLCQQIDVCQWFAESGQARFPSVAKRARVWLGRSCSTAFQERVFSTGTLVMSTLRTRTDNERAQRQLVLRHNRDEIRHMEQSNHCVW